MRGRSRVALDFVSAGKRRAAPKAPHHASRPCFERLHSRSPAIANAAPATAATPKTKPNRKPQGEQARSNRVWP
jgi:hypothetical protein